MQSVYYLGRVSRHSYERKVAWVLLPGVVPGDDRPTARMLQGRAYETCASVTREIARESDNVFWVGVYGEAMHYLNNTD